MSLIQAHLLVVFQQPANATDSNDEDEEREAQAQEVHEERDICQLPPLALIGLRHVKYGGVSRR